MKNGITRTFIATLTIITMLIALHWLPTIRLFGTELREVDILADLREEKDATPPLDTVASTPKTPFTAEVPKGVTPIEDFGGENENAMDGFYEAIEARNKIGRQVRVAYFGDSFIEGDILTSELRACLQRDFGGQGVGYVDIASQTAGFRTTVSAFSKGWSSHGFDNVGGFLRSHQGIDERCYIPSIGASISLCGKKRAQGIADTCTISTIYFASDTTVTLASVMNGTQVRDHISTGKGLRSVSVEGRIGRVKWIVTSGGRSYFYGCTMDSQTGIAVDNFSLRGNNGTSLASIPGNFLQQYANLREYDLIVLHFGLNIVSHKQTNYTAYCNKMKKVVDHFRQYFPRASFLMVSIGDRNERNSSGELHTMRGVRYLEAAQRKMASESGIAFWSLFNAMGGEDGMIKLVQAKPAQANLDYTHINFRGGKVIGRKLYDALKCGLDNYKKRQQYYADATN